MSSDLFYPKILLDMACNYTYIDTKQPLLCKFSGYHPLLSIGKFLHVHEVVLVRKRFITLSLFFHNRRGFV